ncbi:MAG: sialate O-acetylesterase, partial [Lachnospiraceae bacterium]|nr:sialate O-acetylesterase [Lachnospiraceae bacterium]
MELEIGYVFTDNCVLQRDKVIRVFGTAACNGLVKAELFDGDDRFAGGSGKALQDGRFCVDIPPVPAGGPYRLLVSCGGESVELKNVMVGDVWLAGGQSNMEFQLKDCHDLPQLLLDYEGRAESPHTPVSCALDKVRFYAVPEVSVLDEEGVNLHKSAKWQVCSKEVLPQWTAVATFFAEKVARETGVCVGIIDCNWGGTSASAWMDEETLKSSSATTVYFDDYREKYDGDYEKYLRELADYNAYSAEWEPKKDALYKERPDIGWNEVEELLGPCRWPGPIGPKSPFRPCGLYSTMLCTCAPYSLRGFIYYQGESDDIHPQVYDTLLTNMIGLWRKTFMDLDLPFVFVQLPTFVNRDDPDLTTWGSIRKCQENVARTVKNAYMAVTLDLGTYNNIHPPKKKGVGERLADLALSCVYGLKDEASVTGPFVKDAVKTGDSIVISFKNAPLGLDIGAVAENFDIPEGYAD